MFNEAIVVDALIKTFKQYRDDLQTIGKVILDRIGKEKRSQQQLYLQRLIDYVAAETFLDEKNRLYKPDRETLDSLLNSVDIEFPETDDLPSPDTLEIIRKHLAIIKLLAYAKAKGLADESYMYRYKILSQILLPQITVPVKYLYSWVTQYAEETEREALKDIIKDVVRIPVYISEVPTGVGKSYAYLVAHIVRFLALGTDGTNNIITGIVSTGTIALQEQLSDDLPKILNELQKLTVNDFPVKYVDKFALKLALDSIKTLNAQVVKGKSNYICFDKFLQASDLTLQGKRIPTRIIAKLITEIESIRDEVNRIAHNHRPEIPATVFEKDKSDVKTFVATLFEPRLYDKIKALGSIQENTALIPYAQYVTINENEAVNCNGCPYADVCYYNLQQMYITGKKVGKILHDLSSIGTNKLTHQLLIINHALLAKQIVTGNLFTPKNLKRQIFLTLDEGHEVDETFLKELEQKFNPEIVRILNNLIGRVNYYVHADEKYLTEYLQNKLQDKQKDSINTAQIKAIVRFWNDLVDNSSILPTLQGLSDSVELINRLLQRMYYIASEEILQTITTCPSSVNTYSSLLSTKNANTIDFLQKVVTDKSYLEKLWNRVINSKQISNATEDELADIDIDLLQNNSILINALLSKIDENEECLEFFHTHCNKSFHPIVCSYKKHRQLLSRLLEIMYSIRIIMYWLATLFRAVLNSLRTENGVIQTFNKYLDSIFGDNDNDDNKLYLAIKTYFRIKVTNIIRLLYNALSIANKIIDNPANTIDLLVWLENYTVEGGAVKLHPIPDRLQKIMDAYQIPTIVARSYLHHIIKRYVYKDISSAALGNIRQQLNGADEIILSLSHKHKLEELERLRQEMNQAYRDDSVTISPQQYKLLIQTLVNLIFSKFALIYVYPYPEIIVHRIDSSVFLDTIASNSLIDNRLYTPYVVNFINITSATLNSRLLEDFFINTRYYNTEFEQYKTVFNLDENLELVICKNCDVNKKAQLYRQIEKVIDELLQRYNKVMVLFTAIQDLQAIYNKLSKRQDRTFKIFAQTYQGVKEMIHRFKAEKGKAVLLGVEIFWKGISIEGPKGIVIVRLPFSVPDPITDKRKDYLAYKYIEYKYYAEQKHIKLSQAFYVAFLQYNVNTTIQKLKQGIGRAIRTQTDYATVVLMDNRVITNKFYGKQILRELYKIVQPTFRDI